MDMTVFPLLARRFVHVSKKFFKFVLLFEANLTVCKVVTLCHHFYWSL